MRLPLLQLLDDFTATRSTPSKRSQGRRADDAAARTAAADFRAARAPTVGDMPTYSTTHWLPDLLTSSSSAMHAAWGVRVRTGSLGTSGRSWGTRTARTAHASHEPSILAHSVGQGLWRETGGRDIIGRRRRRNFNVPNSKFSNTGSRTAQDTCGRQHHRFLGREVLGVLDSALDSRPSAATRDTHKGPRML